MTTRRARSVALLLSGALMAGQMPALAQIGVDGAVPPPPPPPASAEAAEWYVSISGGPTQGPVTMTRLKAMAASGELKPTDQVYSAKTGWKTAGDIPGLGFPAGSGVVPPPPPPPPPANSQKSLDEKAKDFIVGTWRFEGDITQAGYTAHVIVEATYRPDGSFAGYQSLQFPGYNGMQPPPSVADLKGRYTVTGIDESNFNLITTAQGSQSVTTKLTILDQNTVENAGDGSRSYRIR